MKKLLRRLSPFAPDQSGAASVLYELGGILVVCDAGGCTGNICGFDEPRWLTHKSAVFSAGLRDMDAILGRDDRLLEKIRLAADTIDAGFVALLGTPVPAVIGTDFRALRRMGEARVGLPFLPVETTGTGLCDEGAERAYLRLFETFAADSLPAERGRIGVLGATPLDGSDLALGAKLEAVLAAQGWRKVCCYGMGSGLSDVRSASAAEENLVIAPSGLAAAQYLKDRFGTPYRAAYPVLPPLPEIAGTRVLILHQQIYANALREKLEQRGKEVTVGTWFALQDDWKRPGDFRLTQEDQLPEAVRGYDAVIADEALRPAAEDYSGQWVDLPHFAVSGRLIT
jgi:hypothetical protein